ncbi:MAG TPA: ABC transporter transmembrane domain-containing protein, partial [Coleofasciculaceae cyanobacterium]
MSPNKLLLSYALRYPLWIVSTIILGFSSALFNGVSATLIVPLLLGFLGQTNLNLGGGPPIIRKMLSLFSGGEGGNNLILMVAVVFMAIVLKNIASYINSLVASSLSRRLVNDIRKEGLRLLLEVDLDFYAKTKMGDIINRINQEVNRAAGAIKISINIFTTTATILTFLGILISISWQLTVASTVLL